MTPGVMPSVQAAAAAVLVRPNAMLPALPLPTPAPALAPVLAPGPAAPGSNGLTAFDAAQPRADPAVLHGLEAWAQAMAGPQALPELELEGLYSGAAVLPQGPLADGSLETAGSGGTLRPQSRFRRPPARPARMEIPGPGPSGSAGFLRSALQALMPKSDPLPEALRSRDMGLTNDLLAAARRLWALVDEKAAPAAEALALHLFAGQFALARKDLAELASGGVTVGDAELTEYLHLTDKLREKVPARDIPAAQALAAAVEAVLAGAGGDPFQVQARLRGLLQGIESKSIPKPLSRFQVTLSKRASHLARAHGEARKGAATGPVQAFEDCWVRAIYDLPIAALEPLRKAMTYERFLDRVGAEFPGKDFKTDGLNVAEFPRLMSRMGFKAASRIATQNELEEALASRGPLLAGVGWYNRDVSEIPHEEALRHWTTHAFVITAAKGPAGAREYVVRDSLLPHETRYTFAELGLMQLLIYEISADSTSGETLRRFLGAI